LTFFNVASVAEASELQTTTIDAVQVSKEMMKGWAGNWGCQGQGTWHVCCMGWGCWGENELAEGHCLACVRRQGSGHHVCHFTARTQPHVAMPTRTHSRTCMWAFCMLASLHPHTHRHSQLHPHPHDKSARIASACHRQRNLAHFTLGFPFAVGQDESEGEDSDKRVQT